MNSAKPETTRLRRARAYEGLQRPQEAFEELHRAVFTIHDSPLFPAGKVGFTPGYAAANADSVDVTIFGRGGHGSAPQLAIDPIVIAARTIVSWQTIVSREISP